MSSSKKQINLLRGWPAPSLLPTRSIQRAAQQALSNPEVSTPGLLYGPDPGYQPLRESIEAWLESFYGPAVPNVKALNPSSNDAENSAKGEKGDKICITGGASQNLACILQVFTDPQYTRVWMVAPAYFLAERIFEDSGLSAKGVGEGEEGIDLVALERYLEEDGKEERKISKKPKPWSKIYRHIIYCVPSFSNPSGRTMTLSCRKSLVKLARKHDALIITDDVYDFLQWSTSSSSSALELKRALLPRLIDLDRALPRDGEEDDGFGNAVSNGSFSKIAGPGVRTGWADASPKFVYGLSQCGSSRSGGAPSQLTATIMNELLVSGELGRHIEEVLKPAYQRRSKIMLDSLKKELEPLGVEVEEGKVDGKEVFGGYFIWIILPLGVDAEVVSGRCKEEENLIVAPGRLFECGEEGERFGRGVRLCFAWVDEEALREGVERLGKVVRDVLNGVGGTTRGGKSVDRKDLGEFR